MLRTSAVPTASKPGLIGQPWSRPRIWSTSWAGCDPPPATWRVRAGSQASASGARAGTLVRTASFTRSRGMLLNASP
eukprot:7765572-Pyramimonas_sp.AAC.1